VDDNTCIKVYNPHKKELIAVFDSYKKTAAKLGLTESVVQKCCVNKTRIDAPNIKMEVALRIAAMKEGDKEKMEHCSKYVLLNKP
jgi:hypothetical protein